jgi:hypothetical protein
LEYDATLAIVPTDDSVIIQAILNEP